MKRDLDLVRKIFFRLQEKDRIIASKDTLDVEGYDIDTVFYHMTILADSPYVMAVRNRNGQLSHYRLTWQGHEFLDSISDDNRWNEIKKASAKVGSITFEVIAKIATDSLTQAASNQLNL